MRRKLISATRLRQEVFDGASDMWLWRKLKDPDLNFPRPVYIGKRRFFDEAEISAWIDARADASRGAA